MDGATWLTLAVLAAAYVTAVVICFQKGKAGFGLLGVLGLVPAATPILMWFPIIGALRLAKPDSRWARKRYGVPEMEKAHLRFPAESATSQPAGPAAANLGMVGAKQTSPNTDVVQVDVITRFLDSAKKAGVLDATAYQRLAEFLVELHREPESDSETPDRQTTEPGTPASQAWSWDGHREPEVAAAEVPEQVVLEGPFGAEQVESDTKASEPPPLLKRPTRPEIVSPREPGPFARWLSEAWDAVAAEVALHGFSYLGVLLTVVGILGFLLFAFVDVPDATQPFVELFIASVFFGWSWALRRQGAARVGQGMGLIGGIVLPLVVFAGLVDNAPIPPDFQDGPLIAAMVVSALLLAALYGWISGRIPDSVLGYLVGPLVWLGVMSSGFIFKSDEPLRSDAITRLVSQQPAMAAVAVALTLQACRRRSTHRLAARTVAAALVAAPILYLLTLALAAGERWESTWQLVLLGVATFASAELLARWYDRTAWLPTARPFLVAAVLTPLAGSIDLGWLGLVVLAAYLVLAELELTEPYDSRALSLIAAGAGVGVLLTVGEPWASLVAFSFLTAWAVFQQQRSERPDRIDQRLIGVAVLASVGTAWAIVGVAGEAVGLLIIALVVAVLTGWTRWRGHATPGWVYSPLAAATGVAYGAILVWQDAGRTGRLASATLLVAAIGVWIGPTLMTLRLWVGSAMAVVAAGTSMASAGVAVSDQTAVWAGLGLVAVLASTAWRGPLAGHLTAFGHLIALGSLLYPLSGWRQALVWMLWTAGWVTSTVASGRDRESVVSLLDRIVGRISDSEEPPQLARWLPPVVTVVSLPPALIATLNLWEGFRDRRALTGVAMAAVAVLYAVMLRAARRSRPASIVLAGGAMVSSLIGVAVSAPDVWPSVISTASVIAVAMLLTGDLRAVGFVWIAWAASFALLLLLGNRAGIDADSLHLISLVWGAVLLLGGLAFDDRRSGRRRPGEGLRIGGLRQPVLLGALAMPVSLGPVFVDGPEVYGWWTLGISVVYLLVAWFVRVGAVSAVGYTLGAVAAVALSPLALLDEPWRLVVVAAPLVLLSWWLKRTSRVGADPWLRWDVAPLIVAHAIGGFALVYATARGGLAATGLAFALLALAITVWRRSWWWADVANALIVVAAFDLGGVWPTAALAATAVRGGLVGVLSSGVRRMSNHVMGAVAAALAWVAFLIWLDPTTSTAVGWSSMAWGLFVASVAVLVRSRRVQSDALWAWGGVGVVAIFVVSAAALLPDAVVGIWLGIGYLLVAGAVEVGGQVFGLRLRLAAVPITAAAWVALLGGLDLPEDVMVDVTAPVFGVIAIGCSALGRRSARHVAESSSRRVMLRAWTGLGVLGVAIAGATADVSGASGWWEAVGFGLLAVGLGRGAEPLAVDWLRDLAGVAFVAAGLLAMMAAGWSESVRAVTLLVVATGVTAIAFWFNGSWAGLRSWLRPLAVFGVTANLAALAFAVAAWPTETLAVAVVLSMGVQAWAFGVLFAIDAAVVSGPPLIGAGFLLFAEASVTGSALWYTVPIGLVLIAEVDIFRRSRRRAEQPMDDLPVIAMEGVGVGLITIPALVEMFTGHIAFGFAAFIAAAMCLVWAVLSRVRRRLVAAFAIAVATSVLMIFAAAASGAPGSAFWWIVAIGSGFTVMLVAAMVEAYRSRRGRVMIRLDELMEGWE